MIFYFNPVQCISTTASPHAQVAADMSYLAVCGGIDPVVIHTSLIPEWDGQLPRAALTLSNQETAVDKAAEEILCRAAGHGSMVPGMLLQAVHWSDVVAWHPTLSILGANFTPLAILVVTKDS